MGRLRFVTARDLFEAFPIALDELQIEPNDEPSLEFLRALVDRGAVEQAVGFVAYLLPRREAVWWGCRSVREIIPQRTPDEEAAIRLAEDWVREPEEERRVAALDLGMRQSNRLATTWLALAAGWSGGSMNPGVEGSPQVQPHQTARAVRAALLIAGCRVGMEEKAGVFRRCLEDGARLAGDESVRI
jgi:Family of unknown function (DUF6931)